MSEWKPTDDEAASMFITGWCCDTNPETARTEPASAWSRWLAAHDAKVQESILREASAGFRHCPDYPYRAARWRATEDYLDDMADRIARGEGSE